MQKLETEEQNISPRNRKRKKEPKFSEFKEYYRQRLREGNPITANEIKDMFKDAFKDIFESMFKAELDDTLEDTKYDYKNSTGKNYKNGSYKKL